MRISFSPDPRAVELQRYAIDNMNNQIARITTSEDSPYRPGESFDVSLRGSLWGLHQNSLTIREYDRAAATWTTGNIEVIADRLHIY